MRIIIFTLIVLIFNSCALFKTPQERLDYLIDKYPELNKNDTIYELDTTYTEKLFVDTQYILKRGITDTLVLIEKNLETRIIRHYDTLFVKTVVEPDTIIKEKIVKVNTIKTMTIKTWDALEIIWNSWKWYFLIICVIIIILIIRKIFK